MGFVVRVYDRGNNLLAELDNLENCKRSWVLNKYAGATIPIPINHPKATEDILAKGNRVLVLSDLGVEPWGGLIGVARGWDTTKIEVTCLSMAAMWERRKIRAADFTAYTPGQVFTEAVGIANGVEHTGIIAGSVVAGGPTLELHPRLQNVYKFMGDLQQMCGYDWYLSYDAATRLWLANLAVSKSTDKTGDVILTMGETGDIEGEPKYTEEETELFNAVTAVGAGDTWENRVKVDMADVDSIATYGLRETVIEFDDIGDAGPLTIRAQQFLAAHSKPVRRLEVSINNSHGYFSQITEGDIIGVSLPDYAFTGLYVPIKILGRELDEENEVLTLAATVVEASQAYNLRMFNTAHWGSGGYAMATEAAQIIKAPGLG